MLNSLMQPLDIEYIMKKKKSLKRILLSTSKERTSLRIAIFGGSSTQEIRSVLELFLLDKGIEPVFYESEYNRWYEDIAFGNNKLDMFKPQIAIIHTSFVNLIELPKVVDEKNHAEVLIESAFAKFEFCWKKLQAKFDCAVIQNNFEAPFYRSLGNLDNFYSNGITRFVNELNLRFAEYALKNNNFYINDINYLSASIGLEKWYDREFYHLYKFAFSYDAIPHYCYNVSAIIGAIVGKNKKCLVLDLDNTLWGGIIGDDGIDNLKIGHETALGEGFYEFQKYILELKARGVILAVCSKNDDEIAKSGFNHPDSALKLDDFASFYANWEPKHLNIVRIAKEINIGLDSLVFIDDNPVERQIVRDNLPEVTVPEVMGGNPASYIRALENGKYFETIAVSKDDLQRNRTYIENRKRYDLEKQFTSYNDFLKSLNMKAEIKCFNPTYLDRITQLTNKTNQFNLTTRRYTRAEIEAVAKSSEYITLYGRLADRFGDSGLVSIIVGHIIKKEVHIDLWLMSCRVLKRNFEAAMFQEFVKQARLRGIDSIIGYYFKTHKNAMVKSVYADFGFKIIERNGEDTVWMMDVNDFEEKEFPIEIEEGIL